MYKTKYYNIYIVKHKILFPKNKNDTQFSEKKNKLQSLK